MVKYIWMIMLLFLLPIAFAAFPANPAQVLEFNTDVPQNGLFIDAVGLHNGNNTGNVTYNSTGGKLNGGYYFDGSKIVSSVYTPEGGEFTTCLWGNTTDGNRYQALFGYQHVTSNQITFTLDTRSSANNVRVDIRTSGGYAITGTGSAGTVLNTWVLYCSQWKSGNLSVWINGNIFKSIGTSGTFNSSATGNWPIGSWNSGNFFKGYVDQYSVWNRALNSSEMSDLYNGGAGIEYNASDTTAPVITAPANASIISGWSGVNFTANEDVTWFINDTTNFAINTTGYLNWTSSLAIKSYYVNVSANDTSNNTGSVIFNLNVTNDVTPPTLSAPANVSITYPSGFAGAQFNATDASGILGWGVNNALFSINSSGFLTGTGFIYGTSYSINVSVNDTDNNVQSVLYKVNTSKAASITYAYINGSRANYSIMSNSNGYSNSTTFNCEANVGGEGYISLKVNGTQVAYNAAPSYSANYTTALRNISCTQDASTNYNLSAELWLFTVTTYVDSVYPVLTAPANSSVGYGTGWSGVSFSASDNVGISGWLINDTTNFTINSSGYLTWNSQFGVGVYYVNVSVNDTSGNRVSTIYNLNVTSDTTAPVWTYIPANATATGIWGGADFNATDAIGIKGYYSNSSNFSMNSSGYLSMPYAMHNGTYIVNISVNDTSNNINWTLYSINITEIDNIAPVISAPMNETVVFNAGWGGVTFNATDNWGLGNWSINDSSFLINASGYLNWTTQHAIANYTVVVTIYDTSGNNASWLYGLKVLAYNDTVAPTFTGLPSAQSLMYGVAFTGVTFNASDDVGVTSWSVNDTGFTIANGLLNWVSQRAVSVYYINVTAYDGNDNRVSTTWNLNITPYIDTAAPILTRTANDTTISHGASISIQYTAVDNIGIYGFYVNDTNFSITSAGLLTLVGVPAVGTYYVNVSVNDTSGNIDWDIYNLNITNDTTSPNIENGNDIAYTSWSGKQVIGTDDVGIVNWTVTNSNFSINGTGWITYIGNWTYGNWTTNVTAYDAVGNSDNATFTLEISEEPEGLHLWVCPATSNAWWFIYLIIGMSVLLIVLAHATGEGLFGFLAGLIILFSFGYIGACALIMTIIIPIAGLLIIGYYTIYFGKEE